MLSSRILGPLLLAASTACASSGSAPLADFQRALEARTAQDWPQFLERTKALAAYAPANPTLGFLHAEALAAGANRDAALELLTALADHGYHYRFWERATFASVLDDPRVEAVREQMLLNARPSGEVLRVIKSDKPGLEPEGIERFERGWLIGAIDGSIYLIEESGATTRWWQDPQPRRRALGLRFDPERRALWACSNDTDEQNPRGELLRISLPAFTVARHALPDARSLCNDVVLLDAGRVAVTDSNRGAVWMFDAEGAWSELARELGYPNGLTYFSETRTVIVADLRGLWAIDLDPRRLRAIDAPASMFAGAIDGLYRTGKALIGIQNGVQPERVVRVELDQQQQQVVRVEVLASALPALSLMTTAALQEGKLAVLTSTTTADRATHIVELAL